MSELDEHQEALNQREEFRLELPPGHPGIRPFSALLAGLEEVGDATEMVEPVLEKIQKGEVLYVEDVAKLLANISRLGAALSNALQCLAPLHGALQNNMTPE